MLHKIVIYIGVFFTQLTLFSQNIPKDWEGNWIGELFIHYPGGQQKNTQMKLQISPTDSVNIWTWNIQYGENDKRNYLLKLKDIQKGLFEIDEQNGIVLKEVLIQNKLFSVFEVSGSVLQGITTFNKDQIIWEISSFRNDNNEKSGGLNEEIPEVKSYFIGVYQRCELKKLN